MCMQNAPLPAQTPECMHACRAVSRYEGRDALRAFMHPSLPASMQQAPSQAYSCTCIHPPSPPKTVRNTACAQADIRASLQRGSKDGLEHAQHRSSIDRASVNPMDRIVNALTTAVESVAQESKSLSNLVLK